MNAHGISVVSNDLGKAGGGREVGVGAVQGSSEVGIASSPAVVDLCDHSCPVSVTLCRKYIVLLLLTRFPSPSFALLSK